MARSRVSRLVRCTRQGPGSWARCGATVALAAALVASSAAPAAARSTGPVRSGVESPSASGAGPEAGAAEFAPLERVAASGPAHVPLGAAGGPGSLSAAADGGTAVVQAASGAWWDGTSVPAGSPPVFVAQGRCGSYDGWLALAAGGPLSKACGDDGGSQGGGILSGSPRGVAWFEDYDLDGPFVGVELVGGAVIAQDAYRALGLMDMVFEGGTFTADFAACEHRTESGYSSCVALVTGASLPPGGFVGAAAAGTEPPRTSHGTGASGASDEAPSTPPAERAALVALYNATDGPNWTRNTGWNTTAPVGDWYGVTTNDSGSVTALYLFRNSLSGSIPTNLTNLTNLTHLWLDSNSLSGSIPTEIGNLTNLTWLSLHSNSLSGSIPTELTNLTNLTQLWLYSNSLSGSIPTEIGNLTNLTHLSLSGNSLSGSIPTEIGNLTNLTHLFLHGNSLSGSIPTEIGNLTNLVWLWLESNSLSGSIPTEIGNLTNLTHLSLSGNSLSGSIPTEIGNLTNFTQLWLDSNSLSGSIPTEIGNLTNLVWLSLYGNSLSGSIPTELGNLTNLTHLWLDSNSLSGSIPTEIGNLTNLVWLSLSGNSLSGSIPTELGNLTNLTHLWLGSNSLSGSIPTELGNLTNLTQLYLDSNSLSGSIPTELTNLTNLTQLYLDNNSLSGCVPAALAAVRSVRFDPSLSYCETARVSVSDARSGEGDATVVFTATLTPSNTADAAAASPVSFDYATAAGTATAGSDYTPVSGTVTVPAGGRRATITVELLDDSATESTESFTLRLTNPQGAVLSDTTATATIIDDDGPAPTPAAPTTVCDGATIRGSVGDVFEVTQPGFDGWHHVLVDLDVTCDDLSSAVGYPTAVKVIFDPSLASDPSRHCLTRTGTRTSTAAVAAAAGCPTFASPAPTRFTSDGRSTHLLWIPDTAIGQDHQMRAWIDADRDGALDADEPYVTFESNFASRTLAGTGFHDYEYPQHFEVDLVSGSTRVGRGGHDTELRLRLSSVADRSFVYLGGGRPTLVYPPVIHTPVGATIISGPSHTQPIACLNTTRSTPRPPTDRSACFTDYLGEIIVHYKVPFDAIDLFAMQRDLIRIHIDDNRNGRLDTTIEYFDAAPVLTAIEPVAYTRAPIAKAVNYVALGDSYSSGEAGETPPKDTAYQTDPNTADAECRRWNQSYPYIFNAEVLANEGLGIDGDFATFACTGAKTVNIYDPADPNPTPSPGIAHDTDRPSPSAKRGGPVYERIPPNQRILLHERDPRWEPRQAVSLKDVQDMGTVDMITLTIGGNDAGFGDMIKSCSFPRCGEVGSAVFDTVRERVTQTLMKLTSVAPAASVIVLGYPTVTPTFEGCAAASAEHLSTFEREGASGSTFLAYGLSSACVDAIREYVDWVRGCRALDGGETLHATTGFGGFFWDAFAFALGGVLRINVAEAVHLRNAADGLNDAVRRAAEAAGAHFVGVLSEAAPSRPELSFWDHSPCHDDPWVNGVAIDDTQDTAVSGASFHPNARGQRAYADILEQFIRDAIADDTVALSEAGLPVNPLPDDGARTARSTARLVEGSGADKGHSLGTRQLGDSSTDADGDGDQVSDGVAEPTAGYLLAQRVAAVSGCGSPFASPGEQVKLVAGGFASGASVAFTAQAVSLGEAELAAPMIAAVTADGDGGIEVTWTVPSAPAASVDAAPRAYLVSASGPGPGGGTHTTYMIEPLVAYPGTALCAATDTASTTLGQAVSMAVLSNDTAPEGGTLDTSSVEVRGGSGGSASVDAATGVVTFTARCWVPRNRCGALCGV